jgi:aminopeptidase YwaD
LFEKWIKPFREELSGQRALRHLQAISQYHRIPASPGYREAAKYCADQLEQSGLDCTIIRYPADPAVQYGSQRMFREWHCREAELYLLTPRKQLLAQYSRSELSIIQRSSSTPPEGVTAELVVVENAEDPSSYNGIDVGGKMVLARGNVQRIFDLAVRKHGAVGLVVDNLAEISPHRREILSEALEYTSFRWEDEKETGFGFVVSPQVGNQLRQLCKYGKVCLFARVDADLYVGEMENVEAVIPGQTSEELLLISHLCHPRPGANDNASGPSVLLEVARTFQQLIQQGVITRPRRTLRFLLVPEMIGTHVYVHMNQQRIHKTLAALNLDMVGADQAKTGSVMTIEKPSRSQASFVGELIFEIFQEVVRNASNLSESTVFSTVHSVLTEFSGGSDHAILSDPTVNVPCPMIGAWPDLYYHTSMDTVDKIDPQMMKQVGVAACTYLYWLSNADYSDLVAFASRLTSHLTKSLSQVVDHCLTGKISIELAQKQLTFLGERYLDDLKALGQLLKPSEKQVCWVGWLKQKQRDWMEWMKQKRVQVDCYVQISQQEITELEKGNCADLRKKVASAQADPMLEKVFVRTTPGPIDWLSIRTSSTLTEKTFSTFQEEQSREPKSSLLRYLLLYWIDGKRSLREVIDLVEQECGTFNRSFAFRYIQVLLEAGFVVEKEC